MGIPTAFELYAEVLDIIQDPSFEQLGQYAQGTITVADIPSIDETFQIDEQVFTFKALRSGEGEVTIGATSAACGTNIASAINADMSIVAATNSGGVVTVTASEYGPGTIIRFTESASNITMDDGSTDSSGALGGTTAGRKNKRILEYFNDALREISTRIRLPWLLTSATVTTTSAAGSVDVPSNFHRDLHHVWNVTHEIETNIYDSLEDLYREWDEAAGDDGDVYGVALVGSALHYQYIPRASAETLRLFFYRYPTFLVNMSDRPVDVPEKNAKGLLISYACKKAYNLIEDGVEGKKVNTDKWEREFEREYAKLRMVVHTRSKPNVNRKKKFWI